MARYLASGKSPFELRENLQFMFTATGYASDSRHLICFFWKLYLGHVQLHLIFSNLVGSDHKGLDINRDSGAPSPGIDAQSLHAETLRGK